MSETFTPEVGQRLTSIKRVYEVTKVNETDVEVRDQWGWECGIPLDGLNRYEVLPAEEECEVKEAAYDDWHERDLRRAALEHAIALAKGSMVIGTDVVQNAEKFYDYLKGEAK